jgi:hypothetical protein
MPTVRAGYEAVSDCGRINGSSRSSELTGFDVYMAATDHLVAKDIDLTIQEARGIAMWVGVVEADLSKYQGKILEIRDPRRIEQRPIRFYVGGTRRSRTLIRGASAISQLHDLQDA